MASIKEKAVLVSLSVSCWINSVRDDSVVDMIKKDSSTEGDVHRYKKVLVKPEMLKPVRAAEAALREHWRWHTLPWGNDGIRVLPSVKFQSFTEKARELRAAYDTEVAAFCANYPRMKKEAKDRLKKLYREEDFPLVNSIRDKFGVELHFNPIPDGDDFRIKLSEDEKEALRQDVEKSVQVATRAAMVGLVERVQEAVALLSKRMKENDPILRTSLVANVQEIVEEIDSFNIVDDARISALKKATAEVVKGVDLDALREDPKARKAVAKKADAVLAVMAGYIGGGAS